jgi:hypothetical protein
MIARERIIKVKPFLFQIVYITLIRVSCHLHRPSNVEIGVEYQIVFVVFSYVVVKYILGYLQDLEKVGQFHYKIVVQFVLLFNLAKHTKKVNKHFKIRYQFQHLTACPNDMIHILHHKICC